VTEKIVDLPNLLKGSSPTRELSFSIWGDQFQAGYNIPETWEQIRNATKEDGQNET
jgi:hypothetical protein